MFQHEIPAHAAGSPPFAEVYDSYAPRVYRFCLSLLRDPHRAEDVASEVFVSAFKAYPSLDIAPDRIQVWLFTIARNAAIDDIRKHSRLRLFTERMARSHAETAIDPEQVASLHHEVQRVSAAINTLGERDRTLISLRIDGELAYTEMASVLNMNEEAVAKATRRALQRLRRLLKEAPA